MEWFELMGIIIGPGGAVYVSMRMALNGLKNDVKEVKRDIRDIRDFTIRFDPDKQV